MSHVDSIVAFFKRQSKGWIFIQALALVALIGFVDYITGYEVTIFPFYSIPVLLAIFFGNQRLATIICVCSALAWWGADTASGHKYSREWLQIWDAIVRLMLFCLVMFAGTSVRQQRDASRARVALLERMHRLEHEIIHISERERQRIGRDLHDGVCQYLAAIGFTAGLLKKELQTASPAHATIAADVADLLNDAIVRTRDLSRGLSPVDPDERGLELALADLAATNTRLTGISCTFQCPEAVPIEDNEVSVHLFRIAQEALNNAAKHGYARSIAIRLKESEGKIALTISDDGEGFHPPPVEQRGIGLNIMTYRARTVGGDLTIQANSPKGTIVSCTIDKSASSELPPELISYE
ncbi:MAG: sensor histidine kinase [Chthoniobacter sp.]|nr:sensor histidine kinase [Chthoniobacter sp.]